jgi:hypothetical protein
MDWTDETNTDTTPAPRRRPAPRPHCPHRGAVYMGTRGWRPKRLPCAEVADPDVCPPGMFMEKLPEGAPQRRRLSGRDPMDAPGNWIEGDAPGIEYGGCGPPPEE